MAATDKTVRETEADEASWGFRAQALRVGEGELFMGASSLGAVESKATHEAARAGVREAARHVVLGPWDRQGSAADVGA